MVPIARLNEVIAERNTLREQVATLSGQVEPLQSQLQEWQGRHEQTAAELERERSKYAAERAVYQAGISDPEGVDVALYLHGRLPEDGRPPIDQWLQAMRGDDAQPPVALRGYLQAPQPSRPAGRPPAASGPVAGGNPTATSDVTADQLRAAREHFQRTGDASRMVELSKRLHGASE